ncbi:glycine zipper 2TM domain-containing protein [Novilysobacter arseniciresistens]|uniref:glycine zipper 2TM domain-containing protein n=1 Tax=Novilysobacter arseniciresistens TaxID=1385522 RepID=UPI0005657DB6|nr:glycine zipper 2TM domain-containing protein [Lysobacter arseniciresistens]
MNRPTPRGLAPLLAFALVATSGAAGAQQYTGLYVQPAGNGYAAPGVQYDYARVVRVDPVFDSGRYASNDRRCYQRDSYARGDAYDDRYYRDYGRDDYYRDGYRDDRYGGGSQVGSTMATVIGGVVGAVIGSQVGGGSARYATSAIGSMVGGMAGREIYEQNRRQQDHRGTVTVCDPVPADGHYMQTGGNGVSEYDVTYEYAGRQYTTRTAYHPGDRIRVRVDVRPE